MAPVSALLCMVAVLFAAMPAAMAVTAYNPTVFGVIGDWGWGPDGDYSKLAVNPQAGNFLAQKAVAAGLGAKCAIENCDFVINTGDNFYDIGISKSLGVLDPQFDTSFNNVYTHPSLNVRFFGSLGNHEYGSNDTYDPSKPGDHSIYPQLEYTSYDPNQRWYIPTRYYSVRPASKTKAPLTVKVQITTLDSSPHLDSYCTNNKSKYYTNELVYGCQANVRAGEVAWAKRRLQKARNEVEWSIVVSHHPLYSTSVGGPVLPLNTEFAPVLSDATTRPQLWFNGHDHITAHFNHPTVPKTKFFTIGASGIAAKADLPPPAIAPLYNYTSNNNGFAIVKLYKTIGYIYFYGINMSDPAAAANPTNPTLQYTTSFSKFNN